MHKFIWLCLFNLFCSLGFADTIYIVGGSGNNPGYWSLLTPNPPSSFQALDLGQNFFGSALGVAFSPNQTVYIAGGLSDIFDVQSAAYWTVSTSGTPSGINVLDTSLALTPVSANGITFNPAGVGYIVGSDSSPSGSYWTVSSTGVVSSPIALNNSLFALAVAFAPNGSGYIVGLDAAQNACYWSISATGVISGPFTLVGGEVGGDGFAYGVAFSPSGTAYIVGSTTGGQACYWTISSGGVASSAVTIAGINSVGRGVAFLPDGEGIIVGQTAGNVSSYWNIASDGTVGSFIALPNGSTNGSSANGVAYGSDGTAYIVGQDNNNNAAYWTLATPSSTAIYNNLGTGSANGIAIYFQLAPNPPINLTGKYVINDFGWVYEYCAVLKWQASTSSGVIAYNIYKNGVKIATVSGDTHKFQYHDQKKEPAIYSVTAVNGSGIESASAIVTIK